MAEPRFLGNLLRALACAAACCALPALAVDAAAPQTPALEVIDAGPAVPLSPYYSQVIAGADQPGVIAGIRFPLESRLSYGRIRADAGAVLDAKWLTQPVFLMGADAFSVAWFKQHAEALRAADAAGIVITAADAAAFKRVQQLADDAMVAIAPGPDPWLEEQLIRRGVTQMPVLIQLDGTVTQRPGEERPL